MKDKEGEFILDCIKKTRESNPYPLDIFIGKTMDGKIGRHCHNVWDNCLDKLFEIMNERIEELNNGEK